MNINRMQRIRVELMAFIFRQKAVWLILQSPISYEIEEDTPEDHHSSSIEEFSSFSSESEERSKDAAWGRQAILLIFIDYRSKNRCFQSLKDYF